MAHWIQKNWGWVLGGSAVAIAGAILVSKQAAAGTTTTTTTTTPPATATPVPAPAPVTPAPITPVNLVLVPNVPAGSVAAKLGAAVTISLPTGATWKMNNNVAITGNTPISWVYQGPGVVSLVWTDGAGVTQLTVLTFQNA
jgi:hypothetical protein